jgi:hypothetical protein
VGLGWDGLLAIRLFQALLGTLLVWVVYALGVQFLAQRTALLAALGTALYPLLIYITGWIYPETLFLLLFWAGLACLARALTRPGWAWPLLAGGLIGLAVWVKPQAWLFSRCCCCWPGSPVGRKLPSSASCWQCWSCWAWSCCPGWPATPSCSGAGSG